MSECEENVFLLFIDLREVATTSSLYWTRCHSQTPNNATITSPEIDTSRRSKKKKKWKGEKKKKPGAFSRCRCSRSLLVIEFLSKYSHSTSNSNPVHLSSPFFYSAEDHKRKTDSQSQETHRWANLRQCSIETSARPQLVKTVPLADKTANNIRMNKTTKKIMGTGFNIGEEKKGFRLITRTLNLKTVRNRTRRCCSLIGNSPRTG